MNILKIEATIFNENGEVIKKSHVATLTTETAQEAQERVEVVEQFIGNL